MKIYRIYFCWCELRITPEKWISMSYTESASWSKESWLRGWIDFVFDWNFNDSGSLTWFSQCQRSTCDRPRVRRSEPKLQEEFWLILQPFQKSNETKYIFWKKPVTWTLAFIILIFMRLYTTFQQMYQLTQICSVHVVLRESCCRACM